MEEKKIIIDEEMNDLDADMQKEILKKIAHCKDPIEKIQLTLINEQVKKQKALEKIRDQEVAELEKKYQKLSEPYQQEIRDIISGKKPIEILHPKEWDLNFVELKEMQKKKQVPFEQYWSQVFLHCKAIAREITKEDRKALQSLKNVWVEKADQGYDYTLIFDFGENEYFGACVLRKFFQLKDEETPIKSTCNQQIQWKQGKNLTKNKGKSIKSFFNLFNDGDENDNNNKNIKMPLYDQELLADEIANEAIPSSLEHYFNIKDDDDSEEESDEEDNKKHKKKTRNANKFKYDKYE